MGKSIVKDGLHVQLNARVGSPFLSVRNSSASTIRTSFACTSSRAIFTSHQLISLHPNQLSKVGYTALARDVNFYTPRRGGGWIAAVRHLVVIRDLLVEVA